MYIYDIHINENKVCIYNTSAICMDNICILYCIHTYVNTRSLSRHYIQRSSADAADPNPEHLTPPGPTPVDVGGSHEPTKQSNSCPITLCPGNWGTRRGPGVFLGCPLEVSRGSGDPRGVPWGSPGGFLGGIDKRFYLRSPGW